MNAQTLKALKSSIAHWKRLAAGKRRLGEGIGANSCALCRLFLGKQITCRGCPVSKHTGEKTCVGTPYWRAEQAGETYGLDSERFKLEAAKELAFLESLLPKRRKK